MVNDSNSSNIGCSIQFAHTEDIEAGVYWGGKI